MNLSLAIVGRVLVLSSFLISGAPAWSAEVANVGGGSSADPRGDFGTNMVGTSAVELSCLMSKADPSVAKADAMTTGAGLQEALKLIRFPAGKFDRTSLLHFMAQVLAETGHLKFTEQQGAPSAEKKGWGLIQVTGTPNMTQCCQCVDTCSPGNGQKIKSSPASTVGDKAGDRTNAALLSLCWWKLNVAQNEAHSQISMNKAPASARRMTEIVNAGGVGRKVTGGETNLALREKYFTQLTSLDNGGACRATM